MKVAVLGCGPAGLLAAKAAEDRDCEVEILSHKVISPIGGAQYIHKSIPGVTGGEGESVPIEFTRVGNREGYAEKVYGSPDAECSWDSFSYGVFPAWSMRAAYRKLFQHFADRIEQNIIEPGDVAALAEKYDLILSSVPRNRMCSDDGEHHRFDGQPILLARGAKVEMDNIVVYNGRKQDDWYRTSVIFGNAWTEFSAHCLKIPASDLLPDEWRGRIVKGIKPLDTNCDCHTDHENFFYIGRFGRWKKGVLVTDAYDDACEILDEIGSALAGTSDAFEATSGPGWPE